MTSLIVLNTIIRIVQLGATILVLHKLFTRYGAIYLRQTACMLFYNTRERGLEGHTPML